jgi:hypothetical protein
MLALVASLANVGNAAFTELRLIAVPPVCAMREMGI